MLPCFIDTMGNHKVETANVSSTFLQTNMEGTVRVQLDGIAGTDNTRVT